MEYSLLSHREQCGLHFLVNLVHPFFNLAFWFQWSLKLVLFTFVRFHTSDDLVVVGEE
jgi:hypothetical protein